VSLTLNRFPVVDGTYLTTSELLLDGSGPTLNVSAIIGNMRDDGAPFTSFSNSSNVTRVLADQGFNASSIVSSDKFPLPLGANTTLDIFNLTSRVTTDAEFRCLTQSTVWAAVANSVFPVVYSYEIDRGFQISEWSPNPPTCEAPVIPGYPYGDPEAPYFRCHSGDLYYVFGTIIRQGRHPRDEHDIPFSQYLVDSWSAFGRTKDPNPALDFLVARGFTNTSNIVEKTAPWKAAEVGKANVRHLVAEPENADYKELEQCEVLGFPLDYYAA
jgi:carboxylesterase type B